MLVALTIGLLTVLAAGRLLLLATKAHAVQAESGAIDDGGRYALELIGRAAHQAGHADPEGALGPGAEMDALVPAVAGFDDRALARTSPALDDPLPGAVNGSDVLALRFSGDGMTAGCAGPRLESGEQGWSIFYVARNAEGEAELRCKYRGASSWTADAVVSGVDGFQVLYGLDTDEPPDGVANRYVNADAIRAADAALPAGAGSMASAWARVVSVRIGLLLHGGRPTRDAAGVDQYYLLGAGAADAADPGSMLDEAVMSADLRRRERKLFTATFAVARTAALAAMPASPAPKPEGTPAPAPEPEAP